MEWLRGLPGFLRDIVAEARGIDLVDSCPHNGQVVQSLDESKIAVQKVDSVGIESVGGVLVAA
jgi:hypothetical protein